MRESINLKTTSFVGMQYRVFDITGRPVLSGKLDIDKILIPVNLQAGSYYLRIYKKDGITVSGSFIKL